MAAHALEHALAYLTPRREEMAELLHALVEINSHTENIAGVQAVGQRLADGLGEVGALSVALRRHDPADRFAPHLVATTAAPGARTLLIGHLDTVFPPGAFEGYRSDGTHAFGPGVLDMKGGLVVAVFALRALEAAGALAALPLALIAVSDEEVGSPTSQPLLRALAAAPGATRALVLESGRPGDLVVTRRKGTGSVTATARGRAAHAGNAHAEGKNAIWALARFVDAAQKLTDYKLGITVNVGRIEGGQGKNTVPDHALALVDFRFVTNQDAQATLEALHAAAAAAAASVPGTSIDVEGRVLRAALERTEPGVALYRAYAACARAAGLGDGEAPLQGGGSDANTVSAVGVPAIDGLGPRGTGYHTRDEQIELETLVPKAEALVRFLLSAS